MKGYLQKYHIAIFLIFFVCGFYWGKYFYYSTQDPIEQLVKKQIQVLSPAGVISDDVLESYHLQYRTVVQITPYSSKEELQEQLASGDYDVILASSEYSRELIQQEKFKPLDNPKIKNKKNISPDFSSLPYDRDLKFLIPIFWGVEGIVVNIKDTHEVDVSIEPNGGTLWTTNVGVLKTSHNASIANSFIDFLLQKEVNKALVEYQKVATTQRELDQENIQSHLKSSFIRQINLQYLKY